MTILTLAAVIGLIVLVGGVGIALGLAPAEEPTVKAEVETAEKPSAFFLAEQPNTEAQMEVLLARLEQHVRQERAAVEMFHDEPSTASLRRNTSSPLVN